MGCIGEVKPEVAKWVYCGGFAISAVITWMLRDYAEDGLKKVPQLSTCTGTGRDEATCVGKGAVLRTSFGNFMFFCLHFITLLFVRSSTDPRRLIHTAFWHLKALLWVVLVGVTFVFPNHVLVGYGQAARVLSGLFLVFQIILLLDFTFEVNEWLLNRDGWGWVLILGSVISYGLSLAMIGVLYHYYAPSASCSRNIAFITMTLILGLGTTILSVSPVRAENAGLFTSGIVMLYCTYVLWSALSSEPPSSCIRGLSSNRPTQIISFVLAILSVAVSTASAGSSSKAFNLKSDAGEGEVDESLPYRPDFFHFIFLLASAYMAMLFSSWSLDNVPGKDEIDKGWISVWVKMVSQWVCYLLYTWTLVAPRLLKDREFS